MTLASLLRIRIFASVLALPVLAAGLPGSAQSNAAAQTPPASGPSSGEGSEPKSDLEVMYLIGLPDVKANSKGKLLLKPNALVFTSPDVEASILINRITAVFIGDETVETGGLTGKIARKVIPYGGGSALGAITHKSVDLLTVEYRDTHGGSHGTVFVLPTKRAEQLQQLIAAKIQPSTPPPPVPCSFQAASTTANPATLLIAPITLKDIALPDEYRVLLYEHLVQELGKTYTEGALYRAGDIAAGPNCTTLTLQLEINAFKKGNQAVRASTGPVGFFVGTTSLTFNVKLTDQQGKALIDKSVKKNQRGDSDSLNVAHDIAKNVSKRLNKATKPTKTS